MRRSLEIVQGIQLGREQRLNERLVLLAIHRRVEVVGSRSFSVSRFPVQLREIERIGGQDRRDRVVEIESVASEEIVDGFEERMRCQRAGCDHEAVVSVEIEGCYLITINSYVTTDGFGDSCREFLPIDGESVTG